jgi:hypothetical protein
LKGVVLDVGDSSPSLVFEDRKKSACPIATVIIFPTPAIEKRERISTEGGKLRVVPDEATQIHGALLCEKLEVEVS